MKTYQQYKEDKLRFKKESFILGMQAMRALYDIAPEDRDDEWNDYVTLVSNDVNELANELPVPFIKRIFEENQS